MNFGSKFNRVKQQADRLFLRGDKTDVVGELRYAEEQAEELRLLCEAFHKSIEKRLNTHMVTEEKKHRKVPENQVAEILKEALKEISQTQPEEFNERPLVKTTIEEIVGIEQLLGKEVLDHEDQVEMEVLIPLQKLLKEDFHLIAKQKKALKQAGLDVDAAKAKVRNSHSVSISQPSKLENYKEELEEAESKLEQIKDSYACDLFNVLGKQREVAHLSNLYLEMKVDHLQKSLSRLNVALPPIRKILDESPCSPIFGVPLYEHLRITQQEIAVPIQICVKRMIEFGMLEEGLLRMAGSSTKIKRLKGLFDAGLISIDTTLDDYNRDYDVHVIAGAFKSYLRELPEPLLTHTKHDELIEAVRKVDHKEKLRHMWQVINALPMQNYNNLRYVIKFLAMLASYSGENKMTPNNISIVMAPNLIGVQRENDSELVSLGRNMTLGNDYRVVIEQLIEYSDYFFKGEVDFGVHPRRPEPPPSPKMTVVTAANGTQFTRTGSHRRTGSADFSVVAGGGLQPQQPQSIIPESESSPKQPHRIKKKPAPLPPQGKGGWLDEAFSGNPPSGSPEPTRSKTPPSHSAFTTNNAPSANPLPSPAPRLLHHSNSIRRPTAEPPKPPGTTVAPVKPPRPSPPVNIGEGHAEMKPPRPFPPLKSGTHEPVNPIGFENPEVKNPTDIEFSTKEGCSNDVDAHTEDLRTESAEKVPPPIGFLVEGTTSVRDRIRETELNQESSSEESHALKGTSDLEFRRSTGGTADPEFRKSLEGVLKHQPQNHSRHLVKATVANENAPGEANPERAPVQLPVFPVPAARISKETPLEKPEPAPRSDKPAVPEKPTAINRTMIASDTRLSIHDRPVGTKVSALSNSYTQSMSRSAERLIEVGQCASDKDASESETEHTNVDKPSKPPKPGVVKILPDVECPSSSVGAGLEGEQKASETPSQIKASELLVSGTKPKSDSTNL